jgi:hypothetical protein
MTPTPLHAAALLAVYAKLENMEYPRVPSQHGIISLCAHGEWSEDRCYKCRTAYLEQIAAGEGKA